MRRILETNFVYLFSSYIVIGLALNLRLLLAYGQQSDSPEQHHRHHAQFGARIPHRDHRELWHEVPLESDIRKPRRVDVEYFKPQEAVLEVLPREIPSTELPSTPQPNSIMDRALGKVKLMLRELEQDRGEFFNPDVSAHAHTWSFPITFLRMQTALAFDLRSLLLVHL